MKKTVNDWMLENMWKITISDGMCEWTHYLTGKDADTYSIQDLIDIICVHTRMHVYDEYLSQNGELIKSNESIR
jgi:hypothetical protein